MKRIGSGLLCFVIRVDHSCRNLRACVHSFVLQTPKEHGFYSCMIVGIAIPKSRATQDVHRPVLSVPLVMTDPLPASCSSSFTVKICDRNFDQERIRTPSFHLAKISASHWLRASTLCEGCRRFCNQSACHISFR